MSKSLGNGVDPFDLIEKYGCDAMRYFLSTNATPGQDLRYSEEKMASSWNYINKIWNVSRFIQMNLDSNNYNNEVVDESLLQEIDKWIISKFNNMLDIVNYNYDQYELGEVAKAIYNFVYDDLASNYLEMTKVTFGKEDNALKINTCAVLKEMLTGVIKLLHPFMPFVTEEIYQNFNSGSIMVSNWPTKYEYASLRTFDYSLCEKLFSIIKTVRTIRTDYNVAMSKKINLSLEIKKEEIANFISNHNEYLVKFVNFEELIISEYIDKTNAIVNVLPEINVIIPSNDLINYEEELAKLNTQIKKLESEVQRSTNMLGNPNFISRAPEAKVAEEKRKLESYIKQLEEVQSLKEALVKNHE